MRLKFFHTQIATFAAMACAIAIPFTGCGGKTPLASTPPTQSSAVTAVSVSCNPSSIANGGTAQCTAAVQGTGSYSSAVNWTANAGSISSTGVLTAPSTGGSVTVTAASTQTPSLTGSATVLIASTGTPSSPTSPTSPSTISSVSVNCSPATVNTGGASQCTANVQGSGSYSSAVTWTATGGTISSAGLLTAPSTSGNVAVAATSTQDTTKSGEATVAVQAGVPSSKHVVMVMEENDGYGSIVGASSIWPNLNNLIANGALATHYYANTHPSIGNYLMLTTGQILTNN